MNMFDVEDGVFVVVANRAEQSSIWPADRELPPGWHAIGKSGAKTECLAYIEAHWTDMRPLDLRQQTANNTVGT